MNHENYPGKHTANLIGGGIDHIVGVNKFYNVSGPITRILGTVADTGLQAVDVFDKLPSAIGEDIQEQLPTTTKFVKWWTTKSKSLIQKDGLDGVFRFIGHSSYGVPIGLIIGLANDIYLKIDANLPSVTLKS